MADNSLDILIRVITQELGAEKADQVLKKVTEETKKLKAATDAVYSSNEKYVFVAQQAAKGQADLSKTTEQLTGNVKKATVESNQYTITKNQLKEAAKGLSHQFPLLAQGVRLFTNPISAGVTVLGVMIGLFVQMRQRAMEVARDVKFDAPKKSLEDLESEAGNAQEKFEAFLAKLTEGKEISDELKEKFDAVTTAINNQAEAANTTAQAQDDLARASLQAMRANGQISESEFTTRAAHLDLAGTQGHTSRARGLRASLLAAARQQFTETQLGSEAASSTLTQQSRAQTDAEILRDDMKRQLDTTKAELAALDQKQAGVGLRPDEAQRRFTLVGLEASQQVRFEALSRNAGEAAEAVQRTQQTILGLNNSLEQLRTRIRTVESSNAVTDAAAQGAQDTRVIAGLGSGVAGRALGQARTIAQRVRAGGVASSQEQDLMRAVASNVAGSNVNVATAIQMLNSRDSVVESFLQRLTTAMERQDNLIRTLTARLNALGNGPR